MWTSNSSFCSKHNKRVQLATRKLRNGVRWADLLKKVAKNVGNIDSEFCVKIMHLVAAAAINEPLMQNVRKYFAANKKVPSYWATQWHSAGADPFISMQSDATDTWGYTKTGRTDLNERSTDEEQTTDMEWRPKDLKKWRTNMLRISDTWTPTWRSRRSSPLCTLQSTVYSVTIDDCSTRGAAFVYNCYVV